MNRMNNRIGLMIAAIAALVMTTGQAHAEDPYEKAWGVQIGTSAWDETWDIAIDRNGNIFVIGETFGDMDGTNAGANDAFLQKYNSSGGLIWTRQIGTSGLDIGYSIDVDNSGNAYISGETEGTIGAINAGSSDAFITKYSSSGTLQWSKQLGTSDFDVSYGVAVDGSGNSYFSGTTYGGATNAGGADVFLQKYNSNGSKLWSKQVGSSGDDLCQAVAIDGSGNAYVAGLTDGSFGATNAGGFDLFLTKYSSIGNRVWSKQLGTAEDDSCWDVATDNSGNIYMVGDSFGVFDVANAGQADAILVKYNSSGNVVWQRQLGTSGYDVAYGVDVDDDGNIYITGETEGNIAAPNVGETDSFLSKYDNSGNLLWSTQIGTSNIDLGYRVGVDGDGNVYYTGDTYSSLMGPFNGGEGDLFLVKYVAPFVAGPGDFNADGKVEASDLALLLDNWGYGEFENPNYPTPANWTGIWDGYVDSSELAALLDNWGVGLEGVSLDAAALQTTVPEPATITLLIVAGLAITRRRKI